MTNSLGVELRAHQVWQVLISLAAERQTITYGQLARKIGPRVVPLGLGYPLDRVADYCEANGLPSLTVIVVNQEIGKPTYSRVDNVDTEREKVFAHQWFALTPPDSDSFDR